MTGSTIEQLGTLLGVILGFRTVTIQAPTHVHHLWVLSNRHLGHIAVTILAIDPGCDMWDDG